MFKQIVSYVLCGFSLTFGTALAKDAIAYKSEQGHEFINGGISSEEAAQVRKIGKHYSLQILCSLGNAGAWLADARLMILDGSGTQTIFTKKVAGPLLYINLPAGDYQLVGNYNGVRESKRFTLVDGEKPKRLILNWKDGSEEYETNSKNDTE